MQHVCYSIHNNTCYIYNSQLIKSNNNVMATITKQLMYCITLATMIKQWTILMFEQHKAQCGCHFLYLLYLLLTHIAWQKIIPYIYIYICDRACKNQPPERKKISSSLLYHSLTTVYTTTTKSSPLLLNLMSFLLQVMEMKYYILNGRY